MQACIYDEHGPPDVVTLGAVRTAPRAGALFVRVLAPPVIRGTWSA
jgi:hypothetical protein